MGVQRQYSGTLGKVGNCQIGVSLVAAHDGGQIPIDFALYLPESWLGDAKRLEGLTDSKLLTPAARENAYEGIVRHAVEWHVTTIPHTEIDALGLHVCNIEGMRRAFAGLARRPAYVLTDGFPVSGLGAPALAMWKGDRVAASVAAASVVAKVTRDRMMRELDERYPEYGFGRHKGYVTEDHLRALAEHGPCPVHRRSFRCVPGGPVVSEPVVRHTALVEGE